MLEKLGVIIPTYNRHQYIARQLDWLAKIGIRDIVIMDASSTPYKGDISRIKYFHKPELSIGSRIKFGVDQITSPLAVHLGDDDYYAPRGCARALRLLLDDASVASAQGRYVTVFQKEQSLKFVMPYLNAIGLSYDSSDRYERMRKWFGNYMHSVHSPRRIDRMRSIVKSLPENERNPVLVEIAYALADAWFGKHISFADELFMIRSDIPGSGGKTLQDLPTYIKKYPDEYQKWVSEFCQNFAKAENCDPKEFLQFWNEGVQIFQDVYIPSRRRSKTVLGFLKNLVPPETKRILKKHLSLPPIGPSTPVDQWILDSKDFQDIKSHIEKHPLNIVT